MIATGLKNALLLVLIVLILHFLLKNIIIERNKEHMKDSSRPAPFASNEKTPMLEANVVGKPSAAPVAGADIAGGNGSAAVAPKSAAQQKKELMDFVMTDTADNFYDIACDATPAMKQPTSQEKKPTKPTKDQQNNFLVIHEYAEESGLNGGAVLGGFASGWDGQFGASFQEYSCEA